MSEAYIYKQHIWPSVFLKPAPERKDTVPACVKDAPRSTGLDSKDKI